MKKTIILLFFSICVFAQEQTTNTSLVSSKNEIKLSAYGSYNYSNPGIEYERSISETFSVAVFYRTGSELENDSYGYHIENFGLGVKGYNYFSPFHVPRILQYLDHENILSQTFVEYFATYSQLAKIETTRTLNNNSFVLQSGEVNENAFSLAAGLGLKYLFFKKITTQLSVGLEIPFIDEDSRFEVFVDPYIHFGVGIRI